MELKKGGVLEIGTRAVRPLLIASIWFYGFYRHPCIVALEEVLLTPSHLAIVMEYVPGGNLYQMLLQMRRIPEVQVRWFFQQLIITLQFIHQQVNLSL